MSASDLSHRESTAGAGPVDLRLEQAARRDWSDSAGDVWEQAGRLYEHLSANTNHVAAVEMVPWNELISPGATVLDLGCGSGWVTAKLSARRDVAQVTAWDSSRRLLDGVVPSMMELLGGDAAKIRLVCGDFTPLLLEDASIDLIVMVSAFHHASRPHELLAECRRVLRPGGRLVLANEVPYPTFSMLRYIATSAAAAMLNAVSSRVTLRKAGNVSTDRILYDETLGDHAMTMAQWRRLFAAHPFTVDVIDSGLPPYKPEFRPSRRLDNALTHFVLRRDR